MKHHMKILYSIKKIILLLCETNKCYVLFRIIYSLCIGIMPVIIGMLLKDIIDLLTTGQKDAFHSVLFLFFGILGLNIIRIILDKINGVYCPICEMQIDNYMDRKIFKAAAYAKFEKFDDPQFYNNVELARREGKNIKVVMDNALSIFTSLVTIISIIPIMFQSSYSAFFLVILINIPFCIIQLKLKNSNYIFKRKSADYTKNMGWIGTILTGSPYAHEVRIYKMYDWVIKKYDNIFNEYISVNKEKNKYHSNLLFLRDAVNTIGIILLQILFAVYVLKSKITIGQFSLFTAYVQNIDQAFKNVFTSMFTIYEKSLYIDSLFALSEETEECDNTKKESLSGDNISIEFNNVTFKYPSSDRVILNNVSFKIEKNSTAALVGLNGEGKSTIVKLICGLYSPVSGHILINGKDISVYDQSVIFDNISVMFQEFCIYPFSFRENILLSDSGNIENINEKYWYKELLNRLPDGENTRLYKGMDKKGVNLSGGEAQRVAIARALIRENAKLIILDEPSSELDAKVEYSIFEDLKKQSKSKTCILISHRLANITEVDKIIYLKNGTVFEEGTHNELMAKKGEYFELFTLQAEKYIAPVD